MIVEFDAELPAFLRCIDADYLPTVDVESALSQLFDASSYLCDFDRFADTAQAMSYGEALFSHGDMTPEQRDQIYRVVMRTIELVQRKLQHYGAFLPLPQSPSHHVFPYRYARSLTHDTVLFKHWTPGVDPGYF